MERWLRRTDPVVIGIGTGRTMRAVADQLPQMECPQHRLVGLVGTTKIDGSASFYDVIMRVSDTVRAALYPMAVPVFARNEEERGMLIRLPSIRQVLALVEQADATFVGVGSIGENTPLLKDGFISDEENDALRRAGAVGEITGWAFDARGQLIEGLTNERVASAPLHRADQTADDRRRDGPARRAAIRGALVGQLISGLVTDEATAEHLLRR